MRDIGQSILQIKVVLQVSKMKKSFYILFVFFNAFRVYSQGELNDSVIEKIDSLILLSRELWYTDLDSADVVTDDLFTLSQENNYPRGIGQAYNSMAAISIFRGDNGKSLFFCQKAAEQFRILEDEFLLATIEYNIGLVLSDNGQYDDAIEYFSNALNYFSKKNERSSIVLAKNGIASALIYSNGDINEAEKLYGEAEEIARTDSLWNHFSALLTGKGVVYLLKDEFDSAISVFNEAINISKSVSVNNHLTLGESYEGLGNAYYEKGELTKALMYNDTSRSIRKKLGNLFELIQVDEDRIKILSKLGRFKEVAHTYEALRSNEKGLYTTRQSNQLSFARAQYETEKKEIEIASLSQQASIQALDIRQKNQVLIIGVVVFLFILAAIFFIYKQRETKKKQSQTELEQRFLRSQLNPHFISNALVAVQSFMLKNDSESAALYLTKFSKLMREILENSRKEFIPVEEEISMLKNFLDIHKLRLGSFDYSVELDETIDPETDTIPPMFVQPFVENAVEHGISDLTEGGRIDLIFRKEGDYIAIEVNDNGKGLQKNSSADHTSLSTTIIQERMALFNRSLERKIQLIMDNLKKENGEVSGTKVQLRVPFGYV